eukprot:2006192-Lingulodinium_polyedra.AAC.1
MQRARTRVRQSTVRILDIERGALCSARCAECRLRRSVRSAIGQRAKHSVRCTAYVAQRALQSGRGQTC